MPAWAGRALLSVHSIITRLAITVLKETEESTKLFTRLKMIYKVKKGSFLYLELSNVLYTGWK